MIRNTPDTLRYEHQIIVAERDYVLVHGRFSGTGRPVALIAADIVRIENDRLAEHWDVLQDEATKAESKRAACRCLAIALVPESSRACDSPPY